MKGIQGGSSQGQNKLRRNGSELTEKHNSSFKIKNYFTLNTSLNHRKSKKSFQNIKRRSSKNKYLDLFDKPGKLKPRKVKNRIKGNRFSSQYLDNSINSSGNLRSESRSGILNLSLKPSKNESMQKLKLQTFNNFLESGAQSTTFRGRKLELFASKTERDAFTFKNFLKTQSTNMLLKPEENESRKEKSRLDIFFEKWTDKGKFGSKKNLREYDDMRKSRSSSELCSHRSRTKA